MPSMETSARVLHDAEMVNVHIEDDYQRFIRQSVAMLETLLPGDHNKKLRESVRSEFSDKMLLVKFPSVLGMVRDRFPDGRGFWMPETE